MKIYILLVILTFANHVFYFKPTNLPLNYQKIYHNKQFRHYDNISINVFYYSRLFWTLRQATPAMPAYLQPITCLGNGDWWTQDQSKPHN